MLYKIMELSDLFADACICDETGELMLLSLYGRDTAVNQLFAAFELGDREGGFSSIRLLNEGDGTQRRISVQNTSRLTKFSGRLPRENLFGNLVHCWVYDPSIIKPDKAARSGWVMLDEPFSPAARPRSCCERAPWPRNTHTVWTLPGNRGHHRDVSRAGAQPLLPEFLLTCPTAWDSPGASAPANPARRGFLRRWA